MKKSKRVARPRSSTTKRADKPAAVEITSSNEKAIEHLNNARRLVLLCASAAEGEYLDASIEIRITLGFDVDRELSLAIDEVAKLGGAV